jgi:hypothetical protein
VTEPRFRDERQTLKRPSGRSTLQLEAIERELEFRKWFPKSLVLTPKEMDEAAVDQAVDAFTAFCRDNFMVKIAGKRVPLELRDAQVDTVRAILESKRTVILKARQIGFSTLLAAFCIWCAMGGADRQIYMLSKGQNESRSLLSKARYGYRNLPEWVRERGPKLLDRTLERMTFANDSFLISSQSASDPIRGETAWMVIVDEWASIPDQEGAWAAIEPTADQDEARIIGLSTAKGSGDFFHQMWIGAQTQSNGFRPVFHSWRAVPNRDDKWYAQKKQENPVWFVSQEYPDNPEEAFIGSGNPFFDLDILRGWKAQEPVGKYRTHMQDGEPMIVDDPNGELVVWEHPKQGVPYVIGADVAAGYEYGDWSVFYVMEAKSERIVAMYRGKAFPDVYATEILQPTGLYYNQALITPEVNNMGSTVMSALMRIDYPNLFRRRSKLKRKETVMETMGWMTLSNNKHDICNGVDRWMRAGGRALDDVTIAELKTFVRDQKGTHISLHGSPHDDTVMALAITVMAAKYAVDTGFKPPKLSEAGSIKWWEKQLSGKSKGGKRRLTAVA